VKRLSFILLLFALTFAPLPARSQSAGEPSAAGLTLDSPALISAQTTEDPSFEQRLLELVNRARWDNGQLPPLKANPLLDLAAENHSANMANRDFFAHCDLDTKTSPADRITATGYTWYAMGENLAAGYGTPEDVLAGWLNSDGHRRNILSADFREIGLGYVFQVDDQPTVRYDSGGCVPGAGIYGGFGHYWSQVFASSETFPLVINREAPSTITPTVDLYVYGAGWAVEMRLRNADGEWSEWTPYQPQLSWQLSSGGGEKSVLVELRNSSGEIRQASDSIFYQSQDPALAVNRQSFLIGVSPENPAASATLEIQNPGGGELVWSLSATPETPWLRADLTSGSTPAGDLTPVTLQMLVEGLEPGLYQATLQVIADTVENSPLPVTVYLLVSDEPPVLIPLVKK
jgi:uncharacterized protein YkwD